MKEINAYKCSDGAIFEDEQKAVGHEDDLLGQELEGFLRLFKLDISRNQEYTGIITAMDNRTEVLATVLSIHKILTHGD